MLVAAASVLFAAQAHATTIQAVWADARKVEITLDGRTLRVEGAFSLAAVKYEPYQKPVTGYLYLTCAAGEEAACEEHFKEIVTRSKDPMFKGQCIGLGQAGSWVPLPTVRADATPTKPDVYTPSKTLGVVWSEWGGGECDKLRKMPTPGAPDAGPPSDAGPTTDTGVTPPPADSGSTVDPPATTPPAPAANDQGGGGCSTGRGAPSTIGFVLGLSVVMLTRRRWRG